MREEGCGLVKVPVRPYFSGDFFPAMKCMKDSGLSLPVITLKTIYKFLLQEILTTETQEPIPLKAETAPPTANWKQTWSMVRQRGLSPELTTFNFKLLHRILPTSMILNIILPNSYSKCNRCNLEIDESLEHALVGCTANGGVGRALLSLV